ncbi:MAG: ATP-binding protein, partial [Desulfoferrobacter sp.]
IVIFRVIQEGLNNIAKHSKAELVDISLLKKGKTIELSIEDNGIGFDVDTVSSARKHDRGIGLASMKERVELSGGQLNIETSLGSGTCMRMLWPGQINEPK